MKKKIKIKTKSVIILILILLIILVLSIIIIKLNKAKEINITNKKEYLNISASNFNGLQDLIYAGKVVKDRNDYVFNGNKIIINNMDEDILLAATLNNIILSETSKLEEITEENETYKVIPNDKVIEYSKKLFDKKKFTSYKNFSGCPSFKYDGSSQNYMGMFNCNTGPIVDIYVYKLERNLSTVNEYYEYISIAYMEHSIEEGKNVYDFYKDYQKSKKIGTNETGESIINEKNYKKLTRFKLTSKNKKIYSIEKIG